MSGPTTTTTTYAVGFTIATPEGALLQRVSEHTHHSRSQAVLEANTLKGVQFDLPRRGRVVRVWIVTTATAVSIDTVFDSSEVTTP